MPIDASIPLQARAPKLQLPNALDMAGQAYTVRDLALKNAAMQRAASREQTISDLYRTNMNPDGTINQQGMTAGLAQAGYGDAIPGLQEQQAKAGKATTDETAANLALHQQKLKIINSTLGSLAADPELDHDKVIAAISGLVQQGISTPEEGAAAVRALPGPKGLRAHIIAQAAKSLDAEKQIALYLPKYDEQDRGDVVNEGTIDQMSGTRTPGRDVAKGMTPDQASKERMDNNKDTPSMNAAAIDLAAQRLLNGEKPQAVTTNLGRGRQGVADLAAIQNRFAQLAADRGMDARDIATRNQELASEARTRIELGAREGKIAPRVQEAQNFANVAKAASAAVPRGSFLPYNKLAQMSDTQLSDPALAKLKAATVSLINAYAAAVGGGQIHVHDQEVAGGLLSQAMGPEAYNAVVDQLILETQKALEAPGQVSDEFRKKTGGTSANGPTQTPGGATPEPDAAAVKAFTDKGYPPDVAVIMAKHGVGK